MISFLKFWGPNTASSRILRPYCHFLVAAWGFEAGKALQFRRWQVLRIAPYQTMEPFWLDGLGYGLEWRWRPFHTSEGAELPLRYSPITTARRGKDSADAACDTQSHSGIGAAIPMPDSPAVSPH